VPLVVGPSPTLPLRWGLSSEPPSRPPDRQRPGAIEGRAATKRYSRLDGMARNCQAGNPVPRGFHRIGARKCSRMWRPRRWGFAETKIVLLKQRSIKIRARRRPAPPRILITEISWRWLHANTPLLPSSAIDAVSRSGFDRKWHMNDRLSRRP
jgi:hypothetical protein